jgi:glucose-1-phosphate cytidylyltransferase
VKVVILCGGLGTRLREETEYRPKPMVDVGGRPILWHIMKYFAHYGHNEFVICLGYRGQMIKDYFLNYEAMSHDFTLHLGCNQRVQYHGNHEEKDFVITLADTGQETQTGGRVARVAKYLDGEEFFLTYGDGVADVNLDRLLDFHRTHGRKATVTAFRPVSRYGVLAVEGDGAVSRFAEKPRADGWVSAGFMVFKRSMLDYLDGDSCVLEGPPMEKLTAEGELRAYPHDGFFFAMDTYREYLQLNQLWSDGRAPWKVWA